MAGGRIYTDVQTIGNIEIYQVTGNPNGLLQARQGSLAVQQPTSGDDVIVWQNTNGGSAWKMQSEKSTRGMVGTATSVNQVTMIAPGPAPVQVQIPVLFDMTLKQLFVTAMGTNQNLTGNDIAGSYPDWTEYLILTSITVDIGPDSGVNLVNGMIPTRIFSTGNPNLGPEFNIRAPAGSTVTISVVNLLSGWALNADFAFSFTAGIDPTQVPNTLIGAPLPGVVIPAAGGVAAAAFNVIAAPLTPGEVIAWGEYDQQSVLTAAAGPRTPGNDDFDATLGTANAIRNDIFNAISDPLNSFNVKWTPANSGTTGLIIAYNNPGLIGNRNSLWTDSPGINVINGTFLGGTGIVTPAVFTPLARDVRLHRFYMETYFGAGAPGSQYFSVSNLQIGGAPNPAMLNQANAYLFGPKFPGNNFPIDQFVPAGAGITLDIMNIAGIGGLAFPCFLAVPAAP